MTALRVGVAKVDITPNHPVPLAGFAHRQGVSTGVAQPLNARIFTFQRGDRTALLISADLIWWGPESVDRLRSELQRKWGIPTTHVLFHATHTHSGPQTTDRFVRSLGRCDNSYVAWMEAQIQRGIADALANVEPVSAEVGKGAWNEGIHRRRVEDGICTMTPNPDGPNDREVTVIRFRTHEGDTKGVLVHATCHPTTTDENRVSSEFPGFAMDLVEEHLGYGVVAAYLQGFCGDVRPALIQNDAFVRGSDEDVRRIGRALATEVIRVLEAEQTEQAEERDLEGMTVEIGLRVRQVPDEATLRQKRSESGVWSEWANLLLEHPERVTPTISMELTLLRIADRIAFLTANAEVVVEYGLRLKREFHNQVLPLGYTNGMIGYVPTARQTVEGGYEAVDSCYYFGLPAPFSARIEADITEKIKHLERGWL